MAAAEIPAIVRAALLPFLQLKKKIYIALYKKYEKTYEGTDKSKTAGIPNLNSLPEGRGPLKFHVRIFSHARVSVKKSP